MNLITYLLVLLSTTSLLSFDSAASSHNDCNIVEVIKNVNVRTRANKNSLKVGYLRVGQQYVVTKQKDNWRRIWYHNRQRWVYGRGYLQPISGECVQVSNTKTGHVNVRADSDKTSTKLGAAPESSWWVLQNMEGNWAKVWYASTPAYIYKKYAIVPNSSPEPFKTRWSMTYEHGLNITLQANKQYNYNYTVDWGDGTVEENVKNTITHSYEQPGDYVISISGQFPHFYRDIDYNNFRYEYRIKSIVQWGYIEWQSMADSFALMPNLTHISTSQSPNLSQVSSMANMFRHSQFNSEISRWDVSNVTDMASMFEGTPFNGDISKWDVSNVVNMKYMFFKTPLNSDISKWDVSNVTNMEYMFYKSQFNGDISEWDVSSAKNMKAMFEDSQFNNDISQWDVGNVTNMWFMFFGSQFEGDISNWDVSNVTNMDYMFNNSKFNGDISNWDVSNVTDMREMFADSEFNRNISGWNVSNVTDMEFMFANSQFSGDISQWDVSSVTDMRYMFYQSQFNGDISEWNISNVTTMSQMLKNDTFSKANYDKLLNGWSQLSPRRNVRLNVNQHFSPVGQAGRTTLIDSFGWVIVDKGMQ